MVSLEEEYTKMLKDAGFDTLETARPVLELAINFIEKKVFPYQELKIAIAFSLIWRWENGETG